MMHRNLSAAAGAAVFIAAAAAAAAAARVPPSRIPSAVRRHKDLQIIKMFYLHTIRRRAHTILYYYHYCTVCIHYHCCTICIYHHGCIMKALLYYIIIITIISTILCKRAVGC